MAKNQPNAKKHLEAELSLFENYGHSSSKYNPKMIGHMTRIDLDLEMNRNIVNIKCLSMIILTYIKQHLNLSS